MRLDDGLPNLLSGESNAALIASEDCLGNEFEEVARRDYRSIDGAQVLGQVVHLSAKKKLVRCLTNPILDVTV